MGLGEREPSLRLRPILTPTVLCPALAAAVCLVLAGPAAAQQAPSAPARNGPAIGLRYLTWSGKTGHAEPSTLASPASSGRRPAAIIPRRSAAPADAPPPPPYARQSRYGPAPANGLTPASAWLTAPPRAPVPATPAPALTYETAIQPAAAPPAYRPATVAAPAPMPEAVTDPMAPRRDAPIFRMQSRSTTAPIAPAVSPPASDAAASQAADPMAPRRDAPIFRMQSTAPSPAAAPREAPPAPSYAAADQPARDGARYYSVHRAAGRQPDATVLPTSVYLDHTPLNLTDMPTSADLAEPPAAPAVTRTINGRAQVITPNEDPSLP